MSDPSKEELLELARTEFRRIFREGFESARDSAPWEHIARQNEARDRLLKILTGFPDKVPP